MTGFVKLDAGILDSTLWREDAATRLTFITMLAMADQNGLVQATAPGIAARANLTLEEVRPALARLEAPDPDSRTPDDEGRRVARVDGGFVVLNYLKYREKQDLESRREQVREATRRWREKKKGVSCGDQPVITGERGEHFPSASASASRREGESEGEGEPSNGPARAERLAQGQPKGSLKAASSPPAPTPDAIRQTPDARANGRANPLIAGRRPQIEAEAYRLIREISGLEPSRDPTDILLEAASWEGGDGRSGSKCRIEAMSDDHLVLTVRDLKSILEDAHAAKAADRSA